MRKFTNLYQDKLDKAEIKLDINQKNAVPMFEQLLNNIRNEDYRNTSSGLLFWKKEKNNIPKNGQGIYLFGDVGRGKSMLMDMFYNFIEIKNKKRVHFHEFLKEMHDYLHNARKHKSDRNKIDSDLINFSEKISSEYKLICFDEFYVLDVADAMLLGRLFTSLFSKGVYIIATSNIKPDDLYKDGLQRDRFIPFIKLLNERLQIISLNGDIDYRTKMIMKKGRYFSPINKKNEKEFNQLFQELTANQSKIEKDIIYKSRAIPIKNAFGDIAMFEFDEICDANLGAGDYLEIVENFNVIFLKNLPKLTDNEKDQASRFINFIDVLYDNKVNLIILSNADIQNIYKGKTHSFAFDRTVSRLIEMQAKNYF